MLNSLLVLLPEQTLHDHITKQSHCREHMLVLQMVRCHIFEDGTLSAEKNHQIPERNKKIELNNIREIDEYILLVVMMW